MDGVQLPQGYRATTRRQFLFTFLPGTNFIYLERIKGELTLEPPAGFEPRTPWLEIQHLNH